mgnify:CR=1 FL=1
MWFVPTPLRTIISYWFDHKQIHRGIPGKGRSQEERADKYQVTSRFGFGVQRLDTLACLLTDSANY